VTETEMREALWAAGWHRAADDAPASELPALLALLPTGGSR
jgi:hypothetical protein